MRHDLAPLRIAVKPIVGHIHPRRWSIPSRELGFGTFPIEWGVLSVSIAAFLQELGRHRWHLLAGCECTLVDYDDRRTFSLLPEQLIKKG
jgi:hypothetical protein